MTTSNADIVEQVFKLLGKGDLAGAATYFDPDICIYEPTGLPYGGKYVGHAGFYELFRQLGETFDELSIPPSAILDAGSAVIALKTLHGIVKATGIAVHMPLTEVFVVREGGIIEIRPFYWDTTAVAQALNKDFVANPTIHDAWAVVLS
jgi:uncharacterized protein